MPYPIPSPPVLRPCWTSTARRTYANRASAAGYVIVEQIAAIVAYEADNMRARDDA